ncbi:MAG: uncharacterized membrane protein YhaH (DUF805 family) [Halioglobus sp.]|jgi:uncharacterized membrane protein YhaH (DUF805 family)
MQYFTNALKKYADFSGRATRQEYWMYILFYMVFYIVLAMVGGVLGLSILTTVFSLGLLVPTISLAARRLHDTGRTGWWQLLSLVPIVGSIVLIVFLVQDSHDDNPYGPNPKMG